MNDGEAVGGASAPMDLAGRVTEHAQVARDLIDEVAPASQVIVLHQGRVVADGTRDAILTETQTPDISAAFAKLTKTKAKGEAAA